MNEENEKNKEQPETNTDSTDNQDDRTVEFDISGVDQRIPEAENDFGKSGVPRKGWRKLLFFSLTVTVTCFLSIFLLTSIFSGSFFFSKKKQELPKKVKVEQESTFEKPATEIETDIRKPEDTPVVTPAPEPATEPANETPVLVPEAVTPPTTPAHTSQPADSANISITPLEQGIAPETETQEIEEEQVTDPDL